MAAAKRKAATRKAAKKKAAKRKRAKKAGKKAAKKKTARKKAARKKAAGKKAARKAAKPAALRSGAYPKSHPYERVRRVALSFPETFEKISHGEPTFWGGKRTFLTFADDHHGDGRMAIWLKLPPGEQEDLVEADPEVFFVPPYVGPSGWVGVRLDGRIDWGLVEMLLEQGYRSVAPSRAIAQLEGG